MPQEPVVSVKSGHVFEKRLIEKIIKDIGRCPVTDQVLTMDDVVEVKINGNVKARSTAMTSVPAMLSLFQNEWDAAMLETHQLRKTLQATRQELSHALYQHDAATRVIARLIRERDEYREKLEQAMVAAASTHVQKRGVEEQEEEPVGKKARAGLDKTVIDAITQKSLELSKHRKKREISPTVATVEDIAGFSSKGSFPVHATRKGGILSLSVCPGGAYVASGGADSTVHIFDFKEKQSVGVLKGHSKKVLSVSFIKDKSTVVSGGSDGTVRLWKESEDGQHTCVAVLEDSAITGKNKGEVVSVNVHPSGDYFLTACSDGAWSFYDVARPDRLARVGPSEGEEASVYSTAALHPDGLILCTGATDSIIKVWETRTQQSVASFEGHSGSISSLAFSENGYYMASAASDGVKIWDLRKLKSIRSLTPFGEGEAVASVAFDHSGLFLGVAGSKVGVYAVKQDWSMIKEFSEVPKKGAHAVAWGVDARSLIVGAADHNLRVFEA